MLQSFRTQQIRAVSSKELERQSEDRDLEARRKYGVAKSEFLTQVGTLVKNGDALGIVEASNQFLCTLVQIGVSSSDQKLVDEFIEEQPEVVADVLATA